MVEATSGRISAVPRSSACRQARHRGTTLTIVAVEECSEDEDTAEEERSSVGLVPAVGEADVRNTAAKSQYTFARLPEVQSRKRKLSRHEMEGTKV